jgi:hypothetical protein
MEEEWRGIPRVAQEVGLIREARSVECGCVAGLFRSRRGVASEKRDARFALVLCAARAGEWTGGLTFWRSDAEGAATYSGSGGCSAGVSWLERCKSRICVSPGFPAFRGPRYSAPIFSLLGTRVGQLAIGFSDSWFRSPFPPFSDRSASQKMLTRSNVRDPASGCESGELGQGVVANGTRRDDLREEGLDNWQSHQED